MKAKNSSVTNIALVGGGDYCREILEKTIAEYTTELKDVNARFLGVSDQNPLSPGIVLGRKLGLLICKDYREFYDPLLDINLIIIVTPDQNILDDILNTKPSRIRVLSYHVFKIFWKAIRLEERKLRDRNEEIETILNGIQDFILVITPDQKIVDVNASFLRQMNYSHKDVVGRKCYDVFQNVTQKSSNCQKICPLEKVIQYKKPYHAVLKRINHKGAVQYGELTIFPIWEKDGKISKFIEISRDITERKREEKELTRRLEMMVDERTRQLKETHDKLLHQDKMASLGKLSASVVHEINNPIAGILNLTMLIQRIIKEEKTLEKDIVQVNRFLDLMETETRRISHIVSNLLMFSRQSKMEAKEVNINLLIKKTLLLNSNLLKINGVKVKEKLTTDLPEIIGSEDQLQQIFMNIISNATEAISGTNGGVLQVETIYSEKNDNITIKFKDSGVGIPERNISKLFEPFFTTKKKGKGVGLGLSVAYGIIKEHGGSVYSNSKEGKGTTFKITLPLKPPERQGDPNGQNQDPHCR